MQNGDLCNILNNSTKLYCPKNFLASNGYGKSDFKMKKVAKTFNIFSKLCCVDCFS